MRNYHAFKMAPSASLNTFAYSNDELPILVDAWTSENFVSLMSVENPPIPLHFATYVRDSYFAKLSARDKAIYLNGISDVLRFEPLSIGSLMEQQRRPITPNPLRITTVIRDPVRMGWFGIREDQQLVLRENWLCDKYYQVKVMLIENGEEVHVGNVIRDDAIALRRNGSVDKAKLSVFASDTTRRIFDVIF